MTMHNIHEDMPVDAVLADGCPRCEEHAREPFAALDDSHLARINLIAQGYIKTGRFSTVTTNDYIAASRVVEVIIRAQRLERITKLLTV